MNSCRILIQGTVKKHNFCYTQFRWLHLKWGQYIVDYYNTYTHVSYLQYFFSAMRKTNRRYFTIEKRHLDAQETFDGDK